MGFDIDCIIDIHTYPGEYFCPVCRTLVYPNEALQSRCTHLYCKPCLVHVASSTRACPYDGYLVTESESKPLVDSDKALSEKIGKVKVHCLYFRSGCAWEGTLSDCILHCSNCSFGNSPVVCNRCGVQIVHRQVQEHAQSCSGAYGGQPTTTTSTVVGAQAIVPTSQGQQNPQNANGVQTPNPQVNPGAQAPVATQAQWNQQYQQYYQHYGGLDPYQQAVQNYYAAQQQPLPQHYEQHQVNVQSQNMPLANVQAQTIPAQFQAQLMPQHQPPIHAQAPIMSTNYQVQQQLSQPSQTQPLQPSPYAQQGLRPPAQNPQMSQYQQPHVQMPQAQPQPQPQPHMHSQPHFPQPNQPHLQIHPQATAYQHVQAQPSVPQAQQFATPGLPQIPQPLFPTVTGHQTYPRAQSAPQIQSGATKKHQLQSNFSHGSGHVGNMHGQPPTQQSPLVHQSHPHGSIPHQNPSMVQPPPNQVPDTSTSYNKQFPLTNPGVPMQPPNQQAAPHQFAQQQSSALQSQSHPQGHFPPVLPQIGPYAVHQKQQSQHQPVHPQNHSRQSVSFGPMSNSVPALPVSAQTAMNQGYAQSLVPEINANMLQAPLFPSKEIADKGMKGDPRIEATTRVSMTTAKDKDSATANVIKSGVRQEDVGVHRHLMQAVNGSKPFVDDSVRIGFRKEEGSSLQDSGPFKQIKPENLFSSNIDKQLGIAVSGADTGLSLDIREERKPGFLHPVPQNYESKAIDLGAAYQHGFTDKVPHLHTTPRDQMSGSVDGGSLLRNNNDKQYQYIVDGGNGPDSMLKSRDKKMKVLSQEKLPLPTEATRDLDRAPFSLKASYLPGFNDGFKSDLLVQSQSFLQPHPATDHGRAPTFEREPEFGRRPSKSFVPRSPGRDFLGSSPRTFGGPSRFPHDSSAFDNANIRIPLLGHMLRGDIDGPGTHGFHEQVGPASLKREEHMGPRHLSVRGHSGEFGGPGKLPHFPFGGSVADERSGFPVLKASVVSPRPPHAWASAGSVDPFDQSRRRPVSAGWCRICELDCETVEALDMHSQTREHQSRAMNIVNNIKIQNRKRTRTTHVGHVGHEGGGRGRKGTNGGRGARGGRGSMP